LDELETCLGQRATNLLQNASFAVWSGTGAPAGWTLTGAGAAVTMATGTKGYRALTLTAGGGAPATLSQTLSDDMPKVSADYALGAFAFVGAGGSGTLEFGAISSAVTETSLTLKQATGSVTAWGFTITINAGHAITVEMPTVALGKSLPYPMYGPKEQSGHEDLGHPKKGVYRGELADETSMTVNLAGLQRTGENVLLGVQCYWQSVSSCMGGILQAVQYRASGGSYQGPSFFVLGADSIASDTDVKMCIFATANVLTIKNRVGETVRILVDYLWG
jgi:hypothetical protein